MERTIILKYLKISGRYKAENNFVTTKLKINEIRELSEKLEMMREIIEKSESFVKFSEKLKFLALKKFNIRTLYLHSFGILPT